MAISFDASSTGGYDASGTTNTWAHTCTGSDRILFAMFFHGTTDTVTGVTYNGASMTLVSKVQTPSDRWLYMYYLVNPASGTNNIVASASASADWGSIGMSYTGVVQTSPIDAFSTNTVTANTTLTTSLTTTKDCWMVGFWRTNDADSELSTISPGVFRLNGTGTNGYVVSGDSNGVVSTGSNGFTVTNNVSSNIGSIVVAFSPSGVTKSAFFAFL